jgi:hypothetical protein
VVFGVDSTTAKNIRLHLKPVASDDLGLIMNGKMPDLWHTKNGEVIGPELYDDNYNYRIVKVDYDHDLIWLVQL